MCTLHPVLAALPKDSVSVRSIMVAFRRCMSHRPLCEFSNCSFEADRRQYGDLTSQAQCVPTYTLCARWSPQGRNLSGGDLEGVQAKPKSARWEEKGTGDELVLKRLPQCRIVVAFGKPP